MGSSIKMEEIRTQAYNVILETYKAVGGIKVKIKFDWIETSIN